MLVILEAQRRASLAEKYTSIIECSGAFASSYTAFPGFTYGAAWRMTEQLERICPRLFIVEVRTFTTGIVKQNNNWKKGIQWCTVHMFDWRTFKWNVCTVKQTLPLSTFLYTLGSRESPWCQKWLWWFSFPPQLSKRFVSISKMCS